MSKGYTLQYIYIYIYIYICMYGLYVNTVWWEISAGINFRVL